MLLQIFSWFWQWKNFENRLIFDEVKAYKICANFIVPIFGPPCISEIYHYYDCELCNWLGLETHRNEARRAESGVRFLVRGSGMEPRKIWILEHFGTSEITSERSARFWMWEGATSESRGEQVPPVPSQNHPWLEDWKYASIGLAIPKPYSWACKL